MPTLITPITSELTIEAEAPRPVFSMIVGA